jgi:hypothetical protein
MMVRLTRIGRHAIDLDTVTRIVAQADGVYRVAFRDGRRDDDLTLDGPDADACRRFIEGLSSRPASDPAWK